MAFEDNSFFSAPIRRHALLQSNWARPGQSAFIAGKKMAAPTVDVEPFHPFVWTDGDITDLGLENAQKLAGDLKYNWLVTVDSWKELIALRNGLKKAGTQFFCAERSGAALSQRTPAARLFKQLPFEELKRMQLEVLSPTWRKRSGRGIAKSTSPASPCPITAAGNNSSWSIPRMRRNPNTTRSNNSRQLLRNAIRM